MEAAPLAAGHVVVLVEAGKTQDGTPILEPADSSDPQAARIFETFAESEALRRESSDYMLLQTMYGGRSEAQPVFVKLTKGGGGTISTYNDWKAEFVLRYGDYTERVESPCIVIDRDDPLLEPGREELLEHTLAHELGHGMMAVAYTPSTLPSSPWLGRRHSGASVTDEKLSYIEGWAEFVAAYYTGRHTIATDPEGALDFNLYARLNIGDASRRKTPAQMLRCEGWVASALLKASYSMDRPVETMVRAMKERAPGDTSSFVKALEAIDDDAGYVLKRAMAELSDGGLFRETLRIARRETGGGAAGTQAAADSAGGWDAIRDAIRGHISAHVQPPRWSEAFALPVEPVSWRAGADGGEERSRDAVIAAAGGVLAALAALAAGVGLPGAAFCGLAGWFAARVVAAAMRGPLAAGAARPAAAAGTEDGAPRPALHAVPSAAAAEAGAVETHYPAARNSLVREAYLRFTEANRLGDRAAARRWLLRYMRLKNGR